MIKVQNLIFDYPGHRALDNISFEIEPQTITALVGPNGAGKSTLLRTLAALDTPLSGKAFINGVDILRFPKQVHRTSSFLPDFYGLYDNLTVQQCLKFAALSYHLSGKKSDKYIQHVIEKLELEAYRNTLTNHLSRGWRQKLAIGQAIIYKPEVLLLDEPAAGLDPDARLHLSKLLRTLCAEGMTIIVSSHILSELEDYSTHMLVIKHGKLVKHCSLSGQTEEKSRLKISLTELNEQILKQIKDVDALHIISVQGLDIIVEFQGSHYDRHYLLKKLLEQNIPVCAIQIHKPSMVEVYSHLSDRMDDSNNDLK